MVVAAVEEPLYLETVDAFDELLYPDSVDAVDEPLDLETVDAFDELLYPDSVDAVDEPLDLESVDAADERLYPDYRINVTPQDKVPVSVTTHQVHAWSGGLLSQPQQPETPVERAAIVTST